ncbi:hypothetical protein BKA93DRAFT_805989 [Sparassis latifolia]
MLPTTVTTSRRPSLRNRSSFMAQTDLFSDSRTHGYQGPNRHVAFPRASSSGGGAIAKSEDGTRCVVAGRESLRILRMSDPTPGLSTPIDHKYVIGRGGHRIEASRNFWEGSGLKIDSATTDVAWGHGIFSNKILTSARNGELIMWDLNKPGSSKYERRARDHVRSIHALSYSSIVQNYCMTGSADGDLRVWDLRDLSKSIMRIRHPTCVRAVVFSPIPWRPLRAITALDNGCIYRWDLNMGQRGQLDRIPVAHAGPILALDWSLPSSTLSPARCTVQANWYGGTSSGMLGDILPGTGGLLGGGSAGEPEGTGEGWVASGGLDRCVKIWDLTGVSDKSHISHHPTYTLRTAFPVRRVLWRPGYECELAIVSNADFGTGGNSDLSHVSVPSTAGPTSGPSAISSGMENVTSSPRLGVSLNIVDDADNPEMSATSVSRGDRSDPIEVWDVRRGYIAKWSIGKSGMEGGVTDVAFADPHAIWAQHSSGTFSQLDLRQASKPLDAIPRTSVTWDASGSLTFVSDRPRPWDVPYDDIKPEKKEHLQEWQSKVKALGDATFVPSTQNMGMFTYDNSGNDLETFVKLAQGYRYEGSDKQSICACNAQVSIEAGEYGAAQVWTILENLLTDLINTSPTSHLAVQPCATIGLPHSISAPAAIPTLTSLQPSTPLAPRSLSTDAESVHKNVKEVSPNTSSRHRDDRQGSLSHSPHRLTPTPSPASSPHPTSNSLPPTTIFARRDSTAGSSINTKRPRLPLSPRRPSFSTKSIHSVHSESPNDKSHGSLRHIGEGALDDSDSSGSDSKTGSVDEELKSDGENESPLRPPASPYLHPRVGTANPSPLSRVAGQHTWTEDEKEDEDSPSPGSTSESESSDTSFLSRVGKTKSRRDSTRSRTRSRSSTVASLAVASQQILVKCPSRSSIRTVTATPVQDSKVEAALWRDDTLPEPLSAKHSTHKRSVSEALSSEFLLDGDERPEDHAHTSTQSDTHRKAIQEAEFQFRNLGWEAMREEFRALADEGNVQTCTFLAIVAPEELKVTKSRMVRFLESYIDMLSRLRLHACAAYMRKFVDAEEIRATTALQTTIHTTCGRCRKPIIVPLTGANSTVKPKGIYSYCSSCRSNVANCAICHLPVRTLLFKCPVCMHGGHQECYRNYYMRRPMVELTSPSFPPPGERQSLSGSDPGMTVVPPRTRGRATSRSGSTTGGDSDGGSDDSRGTGIRSIMAEGRTGIDGGERVYDVSVQVLLGHPCAVGCGHHCWVVNAKSPQ